MSKVFEIAFKLGGELTSSFKSAFSEASGTMKMLGAAAVAIGGAATFTALAGQVSEMNDSLAKLSAQTGVYGEDMKELESIAKNVFKQGHGESFDDVTAALMQVKNNMRNLDDGELERVTGNAMMLANTFDAEVNEVTRAANNLMTNFGVDSEKAFDMMAKGAQNGLNFSNEMFDNLSEYSPLWADMGYSAEQMFGILEVGAQNGVYNLDYLNDVMKEFQIRATDGSKSTVEAVAELGPEVTKIWQAFSKGEATVADMSQIAVAELSKIDDKVRQNELGVALFGTKWEDLGGDVVLSMLSAGQSLTDFEGSMQKINEVRFDTVSAALKGIGRTLLIDLVYPIGEAVLPYLNKLANYLQNNLSGAIEKTGSVLRMLTPIIVGLGVTFITYQTALKSVVVAQKTFNAIQILSSKLMYAQRTAMLAYTFAGGGLRGMIVALRSAMAALNITMLANPIGLTIAAIVGLTAGLVVAYKTSEKFRNIVDTTFSSVKNVVTDTKNFIATQAVSMWDEVVKSAKELPAKISAAISGSSIGKMLSNLFKGNGIMDGLIDSIKVGFSSLPNMLSMVAPTLATMGLAFLGVSGPIGLLIGAIVSIGGFLFRLSQTNEGVASAMSSAWQNLVSAFAPIIQVFSDGFRQFAAEVGPQLIETISMISTSFAEMAPMFGELGSSLAELALTLLSAFSGTAMTLATTLLPMLLQVFQMVFPIILQVIQMVLPMVIGLLVSIIPVILQLAQMIIPMILQVIQTVFPIVLSIIQMVLPVFITLLTTVIGVILQLAQTIIPMILQVVMMVFPVVLSIIQMVIPIITMVLQTLIAIINGVLIPAINGILAVIQFVFPYVQTIIQTALAIVNGIIQTAMALLKGDWEGAWNSIKTTAETIMNNIIGFFSGINLFEVGKTIINGLIDGIKSMGGAVLGAISGMIPEPIRGAASKLLGVLPGFAEGGIVSAPTLAWIGEGGDTETVIPWNNSQRSKDLWLRTGQQLGMLNESGAMGNMQQQIALKTQQNNSAPPITPSQIASTSNSSSSSIQISFAPVYQVSKVEDLPLVQEHAEKDKDDLLTRLAEIARNERRLAFE